MPTTTIQRAKVLVPDWRGWLIFVISSLAIFINYNEIVGWLQSIGPGKFLIGTAMLYFVPSLWATSIFEHRHLSHSSLQFTSPTFYGLNYLAAWYLHAGMDPKQGWGIPHWLHHVFREILRIDPYSLLEFQFPMIQFGSAITLHDCNRREGIANTVPSLNNTEFENNLIHGRTLRIPNQAFVWTGWVISFVVLPGALYWDSYSFWGRLVYAFCGAFAGAAVIFMALLGGGAVNSWCHSNLLKFATWWYGIRGIEIPPSKDGSLAENRAVLGWLIGEGWHRSHHSDPTQGNLGYAHWYHLDWQYFIVRWVWQPLGLMTVDYVPHIINPWFIRDWVETSLEEAAEQLWILCDEKCRNQLGWIQHYSAERKLIKLRRFYASRLHRLDDAITDEGEQLATVVSADAWQCYELMLVRHLEQDGLVVGEEHEKAVPFTPEMADGLSMSLVA